LQRFGQLFRVENTLPDIYSVGEKFAGCWRTHLETLIYEQVLSAEIFEQASDSLNSKKLRKGSHLHLGDLQLLITIHVQLLMKESSLGPLAAKEFRNENGRIWLF